MVGAPAWIWIIGLVIDHVVYIASGIVHIFWGLYPGSWISQIFVKILLVATLLIGAFEMLHE
jgi:hypothetical protein